MNDFEKSGNFISKLLPIINVEEVVFDCPVHGRVTAKKYLINDNEEIVCPDCEQEQKEEEIRIEKQNQLEQEKARQESYFRSCNIEPEYFFKSFDDYKAQTESQKKAVEAVKNLIEKRSGKVVLIGSNGVGKTFLGSMAVKALGGKIYSMYEITVMIRQSYTIKAERSELDIVKELAELPMLVIDELGRTKGSEAEMNWLSFILDKRHTRNLPFMLLSNKKLSRDLKDSKSTDCFEKYLDNDVLSRLRENSKIITIDAPDFRAGRK